MISSIEVAKRKKPRRFLPSPVFVLRTPLLPFDALERWSEGLRAPEAPAGAELEAAVASDRERLRSRLDELARQPELREALFVASPSLESSFELWRQKPESKKGQRTEKALVRYLLRMASRATPFGLFAGCSAGSLGDATRLRLEARDRHRRHTRLDMDYLFALTEELGRQDDLRRELRYRPNSSLYRAAGRLRYAEARLQGRDRSYHLVAVEADEYLDATLERAESGATMAELAGTLVAADDDGEIRCEEAEQYVGELIDTQILVPDLAPPVTGVEPTRGLIDQLSPHAAGRGPAERLEAVSAALAALDAEGLGAPPETYRRVARDLAELPAEPKLPRLFQVDMFTASDLSLGDGVVREVEACLELLHEQADRHRLPDDLEPFRKSFVARFGEGREVPLVEALDEEIGIGFGGATNAAADAAPLLEGLPIADKPQAQTAPWSRREVFLLGKLQEAAAKGAVELELTPADLEQLASSEDDRPAPPDAVEVMVTVAADSEADLARGDFEILWKGATGPSGVRLLGRFCHADSAIDAGVRQHLEAEEALVPDALFAEIAHLPGGRIGNVLCRPVLRGWEIPYLGRSGAPRGRQIPVTDLRVSVAGSEVVLRSARLGRRVLPRLTTAHNYGRASLGVYRFLGAMQSQGVASGLTWSWGALENAAFKPRVRAGRLVLSRASWRVTKDELSSFDKATPAARFDAVRTWRRRRCLPRYAVLVDADQELLVDFDNVLSIDAWLDRLGGRTIVELAELYPTPGRLPAHGPEGRFTHELMMSFVRPGKNKKSARPAGPPAPAAGGAAARRARRSFPPGSEWLFCSLYTGTATADQVLREVVGPTARHAVRSGAADRWFFIRYGDPDRHLRVRLHGEPSRLLGDVLPRLERLAAPLMDDGRLWRLGLDTYERELERYGGDAGIELLEEVFFRDSEAVLALVHMLEGDEGEAMRWRLALRGIHALFDDMGFDLEARVELSRRLAAGYRREFAGGKALTIELGNRFRKERPGLESLLDPAADRASELWPGLAALRHRSKQLAPVWRRLRRRADDGRLATPLDELFGSVAHIHVNRLIRSNQRAHELVLFDFLTRLYRSRKARQR